MSSQFVADFMEELNKFRNKPTSIEKTLGTLGLGLSRFKSKQGTEFREEMDRLRKSLGDIAKMPPMKMNKDLEQVALKEIYNISSGRKYNHFTQGANLKGIIPEKYLDQDCLMIADDGVDSPEQFVIKILLNKEDPQRIGRKYLCDPNYVEIGVATRPGPDDDFYIIVIFAKGYVEDEPVDLPDMDLGELKQAFDLFDVNKIEKIDPKETTRAMKSIGFDTKNPELFKIMQELETKGDMIDFPTFAWHIVDKITDRKSKEGLRTIFNLFVDDWDEETISIFALKKVVKELGEDDALNEVNRLLNSKGSMAMKLTFDEFYDFMMRNQSQRASKMK